MSDDHKVTKEEKDVLSVPSTRSQRHAKTEWYTFRNKAIDKAKTNANNGQPYWLKEICILLLKIYWELKKPR